mgnify:FL=1
MMSTLLFALLACGGSSTEAPSPDAPATQRGAKQAKGKAAKGKAAKGKAAKGKAKGKAPAPVEMVDATIYLIDTKAVAEGKEPTMVAVTRKVGKLAPEKNAVWNVFKGPTDEEKGKGLDVVKSGAEGFEGFVLADGVATLKLRGGCDAGGATVTVYDLLHKTLTGFDSVKHVKVLGPSDAAAPEGMVDHRPDCLQP